MVFLHPEYLWGLLGLIVPVIIHLFDFRKNRKVYFSDIRFLKQVKHASKKPLRLKQWLILLSRIGAITFLVLVFAQPIVPSKRKIMRSSGDKLIYLDNSLSMSVPVRTNESAMDRARSLGQSIVKQMDKGKSAIVINNDNMARFWSPQSLKEASDNIASVSLSTKSLSMERLGASMKEYENRGSIGEAYIISDFQKSTMNMASNTLDTSAYYYLIPLEPQTTSNCVVDSVYRLASDINSEGQTKIQVIIKNPGGNKKEDMPVRVFVGDRQVSSATVTIGAHGQESVTFSLGKINEDKPAIVQLEDYPVSFDNQFYFVLNEQHPIQVLELTSSESSKYVQKVFGNKKLFHLEQQDWRNADFSVLETADFIVLNQIKEPDMPFLEALKNMMQRGCNVLIIPPREPDVKAYKFLLPQLRESFTQEQKLQSPSVNNPFFSGFLENTRGAIDMPSATSVWSWGRDRSAVLSFEDGRPYLSEVTNGSYLLSGPLEDSLSNVPTHALFVPVMYRLALSRSAPMNSLFGRTNHEFEEVQIDSIGVRDVVKLKKDDIELVPDKQKIGNKWRLTLPKDFVQPGVYQVMVNNVQKGLLAFNLDPKESVLQTLSMEELKQYFDGYRYSMVDGINVSGKGIGNMDKGIALWKYALSICLLFLLTEALLIRFL